MYSYQQQMDPLLASTDLDRLWTFFRQSLEETSIAPTTLEEIRSLRNHVEHQYQSVQILDRIVWNQLQELKSMADQLREREIELMRRNPTTLEDLIGGIENQYQKEILRKLTLRCEEDRIYLSSYERNTSTDRKKQHIQGTFHVLGSVRKGVRDSYAIQFYKEGANPKGSFWCSCPDHKFNSTRKNIVCKHIAFLVTRVGRFFSKKFFDTKQLSTDQHRRMLELIESAAVFQDNTLCRSVPATIIQTINPMFLERKKPILAEDVCPICYDNLEEKSVTVTCPTCENNLHKECMEVWLERHDTCVYCRSTVWAQYS